MAEMTDRVGEVIETGTTDFIAQCYELYQSPSLGSLVKTVDEPVEQYGIVYSVTTASIEPGRRPIARGREETSEDDVYRSSPQLLKLLRTEFSALVVGYREKGNVFHFLPSRPARIHSFVYQCPAEEIKDFSRSFDFLNMLTSASLELPVGEVISASLRLMSRAQEDPHAFMVAAGKELAGILSSDFNRLKNILSRLEVG